MAAASGGGPRLGAHVSTAGGLARCVERGLAVGARAIQLFVKSARQWAAPPVEPEERRAFRRAAEAADLSGHLLAHASYLINLASPRQEVRERSVVALGLEIDRCAQLGIPLLVVHPGSHGGAGPEAGLAKLARGLDRVHRRGRPGDRAVMVLIENTAGTGQALGSSFGELAAVLERAACGDRLGICLDTCHALAAGYEFRDGRSYRETIAELDRAVGLERLRALHLNDSKGALGSRLDRHEHIGRGEVGLEAFRLILNDRRFRSVPMVIETPKGADLADDRMNLEVLRSLVGRGVASARRRISR